MSQVYCPKCRCLCKRNVGERCPSTLTVAPNWQCDGILVEHQCGGPCEACGERDCEECHPPPKREPERDALWQAIYAAEFVRMMAVDGFHAGDDESVKHASVDAWVLADAHHRNVRRG